MRLRSGVEYGLTKSKSKDALSASRSTGTRLERKAKREFPSTSGTTGAKLKRKVKKEFPPASHSTGTRPKQTSKKVWVKLSDLIWMSPNEKISTHGEIYDGELRSTNDARPVVLKLVENITHGETEARILTKLNYHSHVLSLIQSGNCRHNFVPHKYIALEKCHRENLREFVTNRKFSFDLNRAIKIAEQMVSGVKHIHKNRIIHKDIKPDNILFSPDLKLIKIADFGLSQEIDLTSAEVIEMKHFGTDGFRPPESFRSGYISQHSDIFSLGVTFYFVLSNGEHPFGDDPDSWNHHIKNGEIPNLSGLPPSLPNIKKTEHLIKSMIKHKINDRPTIWQVSEHPSWTENENPCDFDYHRPESLAPLIPPTTEEQSYKISDLNQIQEHMKTIQDKPIRAKDGDADLTTTEEREDCVQLSDSIWMFPDRKISWHGEIYEGELRSTNNTRPIVLKLVENISHGETEARILTKLNYHSHVLSLIQSGTCNYQFVPHTYIALEKCHHENLREFVTNRKNYGFAFNFSQANVIVKQMVDGVKHIHKNRIIHKDIKPDNILFSLDQKLIKIADFGLSREIDSSSAEVFEERQFGTDGFRPPESFGNGIISQKSDIFSLGVTFYFVLSNGEHPFGEDRAVWNHRMMNGEVDLSRLLVPNKISAKHLIKSMIAHKINHRPTLWQVSEHPFWTGNEVS